MTGMRVAVVAGARGFVGEALVTALRAEGYEVRRVGRREQVTWTDTAALAAAVDGA